MKRGSTEHGFGLTGVILEAVQGDGENFLMAGGGRSIAIGVFLAILSAMANGSFAVFSKTRPMRRAHVSALIFNFWACLGVVLSSLLLLFKYRFVFALQGLLSGLFFVLSFVNSFRAVRLLGVSVAYGIWAGTAALISFMGREVMEGATKSHLLAGLAILVTVVGIVGVAWAGHMSWEPQDLYDDIDASPALIQSQPSFAGWVQHRKPSHVGEQSKLGANHKNALTGESASRSFSAGVFSAILAGLLGGLVMIPALKAPDAAQGNAFLPSFGIAVAIFTPIATSLPYLSSSCEIPNFAAQDAAGPGILSGVIWNIVAFRAATSWSISIGGFSAAISDTLVAMVPFGIGSTRNVLSILAIFYVGFSIAYPLFQCGIIIAGIWGMLYFEELSGNALVTFWAADFIVLIGIILLSIMH